MFAPIRARERGDSGLNDGSCEQRSESSPMDMAVQEAVEGILGKRSRIGLEVNLHEERVPGKGCRKCDEEDAGDREGAGLVGVGRAWMFLLVLKLYQMDVTHAILLATKSYILRATEDYLSAKYELYKDNVVFTFPPTLRSPPSPNTPSPTIPSFPATAYSMRFAQAHSFSIYFACTNLRNFPIHAEKCGQHDAILSIVIFSNHATGVAPFS